MPKDLAPKQIETRPYLVPNSPGAKLHPSNPIVHRKVLEVMVIWQAGSTIKQTVERRAADVYADLVDHGTGMKRFREPIPKLVFCGGREVGRVAAHHSSAIRFHLGLARKRVVWIGDMELLSVKRTLADLWAVRSSLSGGLPNTTIQSAVGILPRSKSDSRSLGVTTFLLPVLAFNRPTTRSTFPSPLKSNGRSPPLFGLTSYALFWSTP